MEGRKVNGPQHPDALLEVPDLFAPRAKIRQLLPGIRLQLHVEFKFFAGTELQMLDTGAQLRDPHLKLVSGGARILVPPAFLLDGKLDPVELGALRRVPLLDEAFLLLPQGDNGAYG